VPLAVYNQLLADSTAAQTPVFGSIAENGAGKVSPSIMGTAGQEQEEPASESHNICRGHNICRVDPAKYVGSESTSHNM
jgi:hypothetical protein